MYIFFVRKNIIILYTKHFIYIYDTLRYYIQVLFGIHHAKRLQLNKYQFRFGTDHTCTEIVFDP